MGSERILLYWLCTQQGMPMLCGLYVLQFAPSTAVRCEMSWESAKT